MSGPARWRLWARTLEAMVLLGVARLLIGCVPFARWRGWLGRPVAGQSPPDFTGGAAAPARRIAAHVERAAARAPVPMLCLPQAMACAWMLRRRGLPYILTFASRPAAARTGTDDLHAWIESEGTVILGALPGPWLSVLSLAG